MKKLAPFLKLYTEYVKNFDNAMNIINAVAAKHPRFMAIMDDIHVSLSCFMLRSHTFLGGWWGNYWCRFEITGMHCILTFQSMTDNIYDGGGPIILQ
jgi:hypothetical protein